MIFFSSREKTTTQPQINLNTTTINKTERDIGKRLFESGTYKDPRLIYDVNINSNSYFIYSNFLILGSKEKWERGTTSRNVCMIKFVCYVFNSKRTEYQNGTIFFNCVQSGGFLFLHCDIDIFWPTTFRKKDGRFHHREWLCVCFILYF